MRLPNMTTIGAKASRLWSLFSRYVEQGNPFIQAGATIFLMVFFLMGGICAAILIMTVFKLIFGFPKFFLALLVGGMCVFLLNFYYWVKDQPDE